jgi:hypothetical protein
MRIYSNSPEGGDGAISVNVTHVRSPMGQHRIQYEGLGDAATTHHGYLDYTINRPAQALEIRTITAQPEGTRLGSLLLYEAANRAPSHDVTRIKALNVAPDARGFYLGAGFHPSAAGRGDNEQVVQTPMDRRRDDFRDDFDVRWHLARNTGTWDALGTDILALSAEKIDGSWIEQRQD